jgi:ACT domain-containing protein
MKMISLEVKIPDSPGSLIELIKPISNNGGNIYGIYHHHDKKVNNMIPVNVTFDLPKEIKDVSLKKIKEDLDKKNIKIEKITVDVEKRHIIVILMGHVFDTDVVDTITRLADKGINVAELQAKFTGINEISTVKFKLDFPDWMSQTELMKEMNEICEEKNLFLIRS